MKKFDGFIKNNLDNKIEKKLSEYLSKHKISPLDSIKLFPVFARRQILKRFLAHTELFKLSLNVPGDIAEFGVFHGFDLMTWANLLETYSIGNRTKIVYGFDNWKGFKKIMTEDGGENKKMQRTSGGYAPKMNKKDLVEAIKIFDEDRFIPQKPRVKLIEGDISKTIIEFTEKNPGIRFSLVHFDCDLYEPTSIALPIVWERLSKGGVLIFDEYAIKEWPGETKAVDEFLEKKKNIRLRTFDWTNAPAAYLIK
tara:strand:- start:347 stop:1105 length:759 start_codon:yes stop_codon:yes gene_type:complete